MTTTNSKHLPICDTCYEVIAPKTGCHCDQTMTDREAGREACVTDHNCYPYPRWVDQVETAIQALTTGPDHGYSKDFWLGYLTMAREE